MNFIREKERIFARNQEGRLVAEITFVRRGDLAEINHTFVDPSLRGQGVAGQLVQAAAEALKEENCKIYPPALMPAAGLKNTRSMGNFWNDRREITVEGVEKHRCRAR